ncbi:2,3-diaminopropionate biosynthesis protein SbnA [Longispora fulva]|uniref:Cysteine synthase A n=1 Tax=Longispora fulva TaxID=619741 RepID=A0A8J7KKH4_9ACTN|nr:2,3-diaminopropionate biosynthesis protein SbnA [Longispora fulva]MBG6136716.1 cysteine synthase A [Longispora fulva]GIG59886.1 2,3-diaminopropionate biosynthesis protein SbnA [Longispora fulva]
MIYRSAHDIVFEDVFLDMGGLVPDVRLLLKLEGLNPAGSIKLKPAVALVESLEAQGLRPGQRIIESSSGNLGIALSAVCAAKGYDLTVVTDPNATTAAVRTMRALGARVVVISERDTHGGYLASRINFIVESIARDPDLLWPNQYANPANPIAHHERTARAIHHEVPDADVLVIGVGTTGTLMGCLSYYREHSPATRLVAVDAEGSMLFGGPSGKRHIPGLGASRIPELFVDTGEFEKVVVPEPESIGMCRLVARRYGLLVGGSTGTVLAGVLRIAATLAEGTTVVAVSPDLGERYLDSVYSDSWVAERYPGAHVEPRERWAIV